MISRRDFLLSGIGVGITTLAAEAWGAENTLRGFDPLVVKKLRIEVGARSPFKAIHVSDTHIVRAARGDGDRKSLLAAARHVGGMQYGERYLSEAIALSHREKALLIHTGDMIDFVSQANLEMAERIYGADDWFVAAGNHEYSQFVGEAKEDFAYKMRSYDEVSAHYPNDLTFATRVVNGVNFVSADNVYYNFTAKQLALLKQEVAKGLPIVFLCHVPLYVKGHYKHKMEATGGVCAYEVGVPDDLIATWKGGPLDKNNWRDRRVQQRADEATREFVDYLANQSLVKAVLCGHCHEYWEERFSPSAMMYVADAAYHGSCNEIEFV